MIDPHCFPTNNQITDVLNDESLIPTVFRPNNQLVIPTVPKDQQLIANHIIPNAYLLIILGPNHHYSPWPMTNHTASPQQPITDHHYEKKILFSENHLSSCFDMQMIKMQK